jgi:opacity protein-like surface antigen
MTVRSVSLAALAASAGLATSAGAQDFQPYISISGGVNFQNDSDNGGAFSSDFTTGDGGAVPAGTVLAAGTDVGWSTEFDSGYTIAGAFGAATPSGWRGEIELAYAKSDVDTHTGVTVGGGSIDAVDAGVLITGSPQLGATVAEIVADGRGEITSTYVFANAYYDFRTGGAITPYVGGGLGFAQVDVEYAPSGVGIVDDDDSVFAWQLIGGASFAASETMEIFGQGRYRATEDVSTNVSLFPAALDIENEAFTLEAGVRFKF